MNICRWVLQVVPNAGVLTAAILKVAAGMPILAASLDPDAFLMEVSSIQFNSFNSAQLCSQFT